jgi:putative transposase
MMRHDADFGRHVDYIHFNPVRHSLVSHPADWPHSSFARWVARGLYPADWGSSARDLPPDVGRE